MNQTCRFCSKPFKDAASRDEHEKAIHPSIQQPSDAQIQDAAKKNLWEFFLSDGTDRGMLNKAKQASAYLSSEARREQTQGAREATLVMMARELAENKQQFREMLGKALPQSPLLQIEERNRPN